MSISKLTVDKAYEVLTQEAPFLFKEGDGDFRCISDSEGICYKLDDLVKLVCNPIFKNAELGTSHKRSPCTVVEEMVQDSSQEVSSKKDICIEKLKDFYAITDCCYGECRSKARTQLESQEMGVLVEGEFSVEEKGDSRQLMVPVSRNKRKQLVRGEWLNDFLDSRRSEEDFLVDSDRASKKIKTKHLLEYKASQRAGDWWDIE